MIAAAPWRVAITNDRRADVYSAGNPYVLATVYESGNDGNARENARLIAAAPALLAAAETVLRYLEDGTPTDERSDAENSAIIKLVHAIRAAGGVLPSEYTRTLEAAP